MTAVLMPELVTLGEVADYLKVAQLTVRRMIARGDLTAVRLGSGVDGAGRIAPERSAS